MPTDAEYWANRRAELLAQMEGDEARLNERLSRLYSSESAKLQREIASYYQRFGEDSVIAYRKLLASLDDGDLRLLMERMDEFARKYPQWAHLMPVRETIYRLNELEGVQTSIRMLQLEIGAIEQQELQSHFELQAHRAANLAAERLGFGSAFYAVNASVVSATVGQAWSNAMSYSERIWANREKLAAYLNDDFGKLIARGVTYEQCAKEISERFEGMSKSDISRLVYTEGTFVFNEAHAQVLSQEFGEYTVVTAADGRVCSICRQIASNTASNPVRYEDRRAGANFPPFHPWCRCDTVPYVDDWDAWLDAVGTARQSGAVSGALNDANDPYMERRYAHAKRYYQEVRSRDAAAEVSAVAKGCGLEAAVVSKAYDHLFVKTHELAGGRRRFDPDYEIAESWRRLRSGVGVEPHDILLVQHEAMEADLMSDGLSYAEAHEQAQAVYNYNSAIIEYQKGGGS